MTPLERQFELKKLGILQKDIAREENVSEMTVSKIINGHTLSDKLTDRVMRNISMKINRHHTDVFHEFYLRMASRKTSKTA